MNEIGKCAIFDLEHKYRYGLCRSWDSSKPDVVFIMLNPSTADDINDDPTIRRCVRFAQDWGYGGLKVVNLFALISSDPKALISEPRAIGDPDAVNDANIIREAKSGGIVIAAWGNFKEAKRRSRDVLKWMNEYGVFLHCLGQNKDGSPKHPLYIKADTKPTIFKEATP